MTKYHCILAKHKSTSVDVEDCLCTGFDGYVPNNLRRDRTLNKFVIVNCGSDEDFLDLHPNLADFVPDEYPEEITNLVANPLNMSSAQMRILSRSDFFIDRAGDGLNGTPQTYTKKPVIRRLNTKSYDGVVYHGYSKEEFDIVQGRKLDISDDGNTAICNVGKIQNCENCSTSSAPEFADDDVKASWPHLNQEQALRVHRNSQWRAKE